MTKKKKIVIRQSKLQADIEILPSIDTIGDYKLLSR